MISGYTSTLNIDALALTSLTIATSSSSISANVDFTVTVTTLEQSLGVWTDVASITLTSTGTLLGTTVLPTSSGVATFTVASLYSGTITITATTGTKTISKSIEILQNKLKIESISPTVTFTQPTLTTSEFSVNVCVYKSDLSSVITAHGPFSITLALTTTGTLSGTLTSSTTSGCFTFTSLKITTTGSYVIRASSFDKVDADSTSLTIISLTITITASDNSPTCYFDDTLTFLVKDNNNNAYTTSATLAISGSNVQFTLSSLTTSTGSVQTTCYFTLSGSRTITASTEGYSASLTITAKQAALKITSFTPTVRFIQPLYTISTFDVIVQVMNNDKTLVASTHGTHSIGLYIKSSNSLVASDSSSLGLLTFSNKVISTPGTYQLTVKATDMISDETSSFTLAYLALTTLEMTTSTSSLSANQDFTVKIDLYDQRPVIWAQSSTVTISGSLSIVGTSSLVTSSGSVTFSFYCTVPGTLTLTATSGTVTTTGTIEIKKQKLVFTSSPPSIVSRYERFAVQVTVYDNSLSTIETSHGPYSIQIYLNPSGRLLGTKTLSTTSGMAHFTLIAAGTIGDFEIVASTRYMDIVKSSMITVEYNYELGMEITVPTYTPSAKYLYVFSAQVSNITDMTPVIDTYVYLVINDSYSQSEKTNNDGVAYFDVVFNYSGNHLMVFTCDIITKTEIVNVLESNNTDDMCYIAKDNETCSVCVENAFSVNGVCQCFEDAVFDPYTRTCVCPEGLTASNGYCITCGNYFKRSEIRSEYNKDYLSLQVSFERAVKTAGLTSCSKIIKGPDYYFTLGMSCKWLSGYLLEVKFDEYPDLSFSKIEIDNKKVQAIGDICNFNIQKLDITLSRVFAVPTPDSDLTGGGSYSLLCNSKNLTITATAISKYAVYSWTVITSPVNEKLTGFISKSTGYFLDIPRTYLEEGTVLVTLKTEYLNLGTTKTCTKEIKITNTRNMIVSLNSPKVVRIKSTQPYSLIASVLENCGSKALSYKYSWNCSDSNVEVYQMQTFSRPDMLQIPANLLRPSKSYEFFVNVTDGELTGSASAVIEVLESDLTIALSRSSGSVAYNQDLFINATVTDPDDLNARITKIWTCIEGVRFCKGIGGIDLELSQNNGELRVSKLRPQATYLFSIEGYTTKKKANAALTIFVDPSISGSVEMSAPLGKVDPDYVFNVLPKFNLSGLPIFKWSVISKDTNHTVVTPGISYAGFREKGLIGGIVYKFTLEVNSSDFKGTIKTFFDIQVNQPPQCQGASNQMIDDVWALTSLQCVDTDDQDYPLSYQYGYVNSEKIVTWIREVSFEFKSYLIIPEDAKMISTRVCDMIETCGTFNSKIRFKSNRRLETSIESIKLNTRDLVNVPNAIIVYTKTSLEEDSYLLLYNLMYTYFSSFPLRPHNFELYLGCLKSMLDVPYKKLLILNNSTTLSTLILKKMTKRVTDSNILSLISIYSPYVDITNTEDLLKMLNYSGSVWSNDIIPGSRLNLSDKITFYMSKMSGVYYPGLAVPSPSLDILMNPDLDYNPKKIYNLEVFLLKVNDSLVVSANYKKTGNYQNYSLELLKDEESDIIPTSAIKIVVRNEIDAAAAKCSKLCLIEKVNTSHIAVTIERFGTYFITEIPVPCGTTRIPLIISGFILILFIALAIGIYSVDYKYAYEPLKMRKITTFYPVTNILIPQYNPRRLSSVSLIATESMLLLALIGVSYDHIPFIKNFVSPSVGNIDSKDILRLFFAMAITQIISISNIGFRYFGNVSRRLEYSVVIANFLLCIVSFILIVVACTSFCTDNMTGWFIIFIIDLVIQVAVLDLVYSLIASLLVKEQSQMSSKVRGITNEFNISIKNFNVTSDNSGDARNTSSIIVPQEKMNYEQFFYN